MAPPVTVLITTYDRPRELALVLAGFARQTHLDLELVVADDGSGPETKEVIERFQARAPFVVLHAWQENLGFRAARSRNNGLRATTGEYVIFCDGDCVPFPDFVSAHLRIRRRGRYLCGDRFFLDEVPSKALIEEDVLAGRHVELVPSAERRRVRSLRLKNFFYSITRLKTRPKLITANGSFWREDLERVNGLDERYVGWGHEDDDLGRRLLKRGVRPGSAVGQANLCHLWHPPQSSFAGRVRDCPNAAYFGRGFYLGRCKDGLVERGFGDFGFDLAAPPALHLKTSTFLGRRFQNWPGRSDRFGGKDVEVVLVGSTSPGGELVFRGSADVRVLGLAPGPLDLALVERLARDADVIAFPRSREGDGVARLLQQKGRKGVAYDDGAEPPEDDGLPGDGGLERLFDALREAL